MEEVRENKQWKCPHYIEEEGTRPYWNCNRYKHQHFYCVLNTLLWSISYQFQLSIFLQLFVLEEAKDQLSIFL
ncbi:hypothetical protein Hanom_Chr03g00183901 [Helianthus anomalus]